MESTEEEIAYAKHQINEANRRLEDIYDRVSMDGIKYEKTSEGSTSEVTIQSTDLNEFDKSDLLPDMRLDDYEEVPLKEVDEDLVGSHIQNVIIDCQLVIELSAKSMFKLVGMDHPFSHSISFDSGETQGFYHNIPNEFDRKEDVVRVIFLTQFWGEFYELSKYGAPHLNVRPEMIFEIDDGRRAVNDAEFCIEVAQELFNYATEITP